MFLNLRIHYFIGIYIHVIFRAHNLIMGISARQKKTQPSIMIAAEASKHKHAPGKTWPRLKQDEPTPATKNAPA